LGVLLALEGEDQALAEPHLLQAVEDLLPMNAGLARELVYGCLRFERLYDYLVDSYCQRPPDASLRAVLHQLLVLDRVPDHAAVAETVALVEERYQRGAANAILRKMIRERRGQDGDAPWDRIPLERSPADLATRYALPPAFVRHLARGGLPVTAERLRACNHVAPLCTRHRRTPPSEDVLPEGALRREGPWTWWSEPRAALAGPVAAGDAVVMDRAQFRAVELLGAQVGETVLDACAAPGGKFRALADTGAHVIAADRSRFRMERLMGDGIPSLVMDASCPAVRPVFDAVLVDVPCSNSGVWARRPEARRRYDDRSVASLTAIQQDILQGVAPLVRAGGRIIYATCSLTPGENRQVVDALEGWQVVADAFHWPDEWCAGGYCARLERCPS
jgi:16S rRNA (cytosine967-C5)-methyltransferase